MVTLGRWCFWQVIAMRRHFWSHTALENDSLEYVGTGRRLSAGFLPAVAVMAPGLVLRALLRLEFEHVKALTSLPLQIVGYFLLEYPAFRARCCGPDSPMCWSPEC